MYCIELLDIEKGQLSYQFVASGVEQYTDDYNAEFLHPWICLFFYENVKFTFKT